MYDISGFLNFNANNAIDFFHFSVLVPENILVLFYHSFYIRLEKINLYNLANFYLLA